MAAANGQIRPIVQQNHCKEALARLRKCSGYQNGRVTKDQRGKIEESILHDFKGTERGT